MCFVSSVCVVQEAVHESVCVCELADEKTKKERERVGVCVWASGFWVCVFDKNVCEKRDRQERENDGSKREKER